MTPPTQPQRPAGALPGPSWLRDPLSVFLFLGGLLFALAAWREDAGPERVIEITEGDVNRLQQQWTGQMGRPPGADELDALIEQFVREEIYYREAMRLSLDQDDVILRRRLIQKLTFLTEDVAVATPPTQVEAEAFFNERQNDYRVPALYSFEHRYFSSDQRQNAKADAEAARTLADPQGDPFLLQRAYGERSLRDIGDLFGARFANGLAALSVDDAWQGPLPSAYGWHLVRLRERLPARLPAFSEVAERATEDLTAQRRAEADVAVYRQLRASYEVRYP